MTFDRYQPPDLEDDWHYAEADDGEAERDKADAELAVRKDDV